MIDTLLNTIGFIILLFTTLVIIIGYLIIIRLGLMIALDIDYIERIKQWYEKRLKE